MKKYSWITELTMECACKDSPRYAVVHGKYYSRGSFFVCETCRKRGERRRRKALKENKPEDSFYFSGRIFIHAKHFIKLPKSMDSKEITKWIKSAKNKKFLLKKEGILNLKRSKTTYTTKKQRDYEAYKKTILEPIKKVKVKEISFEWFGKVASAKQIPSPSPDQKNNNVGYLKKSLIVKTPTVQTQLTFKKHVPDLELVMAMAKEDIKFRKYLVIRSDKKKEKKPKK